jgi:hypothetical protein
MGPSFVLERGYCYTFLGQSLPPVEEMEMRLEADPAALEPALAAFGGQPLLSSTTRGERVTLSEGKNCYEGKLPLVTPVRLVLRNVRSAREAPGPLAAQVLKRKL